MLLPNFQTERTCALFRCGWVRDSVPGRRNGGTQQSMGMLARLQAAFSAFRSFFLVEYSHWSTVSCDLQKSSSRHLR